MRSLRIVLLVGCVVGLLGVGSVTQRFGIDVSVEFNLDGAEKSLARELRVFEAHAEGKTAGVYDALRSLWGDKADGDLARVSGGVFVGDMGRLWRTAPMRAEAKRVSLDELRAVGVDFASEYGLPEESFEISTASDLAEVLSEKGERMNVVLGFNVTLRRTLDQLATVGPGGRVKVFLDAAGEPAGYLRVWRGVEAIGTYPRRMLEEALAELREDPVGPVIASDVVSVRVTGVRLAYYERGMFDAQQFIQPVYAFTCLARIEGVREELAYERYILALKKQFEPILPAGDGFQSEKRLESPREGGPRTPGQDD
ncbi:hypothetical protein ACFLSF_04175 [Candidatus Bipolaricaulota bacterium]